MVLDEYHNSSIYKYIFVPSDIPQQIGNGIIKCKSIVGFHTFTALRITSSIYFSYI